jgi:hypothetical protein
MYPKEVIPAAHPVVQPADERHDWTALFANSVSKAFKLMKNVKATQRWATSYALIGFFTNRTTEKDLGK